MKTQSLGKKDRKLGVDGRNLPMSSHKKRSGSIRAENFAFMEEIRRRAEAMTPVLKEILDLRP